VDVIFSKRWIVDLKKEERCHILYKTPFYIALGEAMEQMALRADVNFEFAYELEQVSEFIRSSAFSPLELRSQDHPH
jgi:hypothetical protein